MRKLLIVVCFFLFSTSKAQNNQDLIPNDIKNWFELPLNQKQNEASAIILLKERTSEFVVRESSKGWIVVSTFRKVIKIQNSLGLKYGTQNIYLYNKEGKSEIIDKISAKTYTFSNGNISQETLGRNQIFSSDITEKYTKISLALPSIVEGSIVEIIYTIESPFWKIDDLIFQEDIPILQYKAKIKTPQFFTFNRFYKGGFHIEAEYSTLKDRNNFSYNQRSSHNGVTHVTKFANIKYNQNLTEYNFNNIPALVKEDFTNNVNNYRGTIIYELASYEFIEGEKKEFTTNWKKVAESLLKNDDFGKALKRRKFSKETTARLRRNEKNRTLQLQEVLEFVKGKMRWNNQAGVLITTSLENAFQVGSGNSAEVNLNLIALLRQLSIDAYPVVLSTKDYGVPVFPTLEGFNYVIAAVFQDNKWILLDATSTNAAVGDIPERAINWQGLIVKGAGKAETISLYPPSRSLTEILIKVSVDSTGVIMGNFHSQITGNKALNVRDDYSNNPLFHQDLLNRSPIVSSIDNLDITLKPLEDPVNLSFSFQVDDGVELLGDKLYIEPLLFLQDNLKALTNGQKLYPIDFKYAQKRRCNIQLRLPDNYKVYSMPKPIKLDLADGSLIFKFQTTQGENKINIVTDFEINKAMIGQDEFEDVKEFFKRKLAKEKESIVLEKI